MITIYISSLIIGIAIGMIGTSYGFMVAENWSKRSHK